MVEISRQTGISIGAGLFLLFGILAYVMIPVAFPADTIILTNPQGGAPVSCLPSGGFVLAQNLTDLCDVTIVSPATNQIIQYNGSQWVNVASAGFSDTTTCTNVGTGTAYVCVEGTNVDLRSLLAGTGISVSNSSDTITITNTLPDDTTCGNVGGGFQVYKDGECNFRTLTEGANIDLTQNTDDISIAVTGITSESTVCTNLGSVGEGVYASGNCDFKKLLAGSGISLGSNGTTITITNTAPESTVCNNVGGGNQLCKGGNINIATLIGGNGVNIVDTTDDWTFTSYCDNVGIGDAVCDGNGNDIRSLIESTGITITNNGDDLTFTSHCANTGTGEAICESSNNINSLIAGTGITIVDTTGDLTISATGGASNQGGHLIASIFSPDTVKTNVGTSYVDVFTGSADDETLALIHCGNVTQIYGNVHLDMAVGDSGTQSVRLVNAADNTEVFLERTDYVADANGSPFNFDFPNHGNWRDLESWCVGTIVLELQIKSTVAGDDPTVRGYNVYTR